MEQGVSITVVVDQAEADWIRDKVRDGSFVSETDVLKQGIESLRDEDSELEHWMKSVVVARNERNLMNSDSAMTSDEVVRELAERRKIREQRER